MRAAEPREQRTEQQDGAPQTADERAIGCVCAHTRRANAQRGAADAVDLRADVEQQPCHHLDVADAGDIGQDALVLRQQARRQERKRRVLVSLDGDPALQPMSALDQQCRHAVVSS